MDGLGNLDHHSLHCTAYIHTENSVCTRLQSSLLHYVVPEVVSIGYKNTPSITHHLCYPNLPLLPSHPHTHTHKHISTSSTSFLFSNDQTVPSHPTKLSRLPDPSPTLPPPLFLPRPSQTFSETFPATTPNSNHSKKKKKIPHFPHLDVYPTYTNSSSTVVSLVLSESMYVE